MKQSLIVSTQTWSNKINKKTNFCKLLVAPKRRTASHPNQPECSPCTSRPNQPRQNQSPKFSVPGPQFFYSIERSWKILAMGWPNPKSVRKEGTQRTPHQARKTNISHLFETNISKKIFKPISAQADGVHASTTNIWYDHWKWSNYSARKLWY